jgi:hypothetical protein
MKSTMSDFEAVLAGNTSVSARKLMQKAAFFASHPCCLADYTDLYVASPSKPYGLVRRCAFKSKKPDSRPAFVYS